MHQTTPTHAAVPAAVVIGLSLVVGVVAWAAFLSYRIGADYSVWQVIGAGVVVVAGSVITRILAKARHAWATVLGVTLGLAGPWAWDAASVDTTGLFLVGLLLLVAGLLVSTVLISLVTDAVLRRPAP